MSFHSVSLNAAAKAAIASGSPELEGNGGSARRMDVAPVRVPVSICACSEGSTHTGTRKTTDKIQAVLIIGCTQTRTSR